MSSERAKLTSRQQLQPAYTALLDALEAATLTFDEGLQRERELFLQLQATTQSKALRHQFFAEREVAPATLMWCWCKATVFRAGKAARCSGPASESVPHWRVICRPWSARRVTAL